MTPAATTLRETVLPRLLPFVSSNASELQREVRHWVTGPPFGRWEHLQLGAILCHKPASFWQLLHLTYYFNFYHKFLHKWTSTCLCIFYITYICGCVAMRHGVLILQDRSSDSTESRLRRDLHDRGNELPYITDTFLVKRRAIGYKGVDCTGDIYQPPDVRNGFEKADMMAYSDYRLYTAIIDTHVKLWSRLLPE